MPPPKIYLIDINGNRVPVSTMPVTGQAVAAEALPVVQAQGVRPVQNYVAIPAFDGTANTIIQVVADNPTRRYLKVLNNGPFNVELWTGAQPALTDVGQPIPKGEVLAANGGGFDERGERISVIYATSSGGASGLFVLEG